LREALFHKIQTFSYGNLDRQKNRAIDGSPHQAMPPALSTSDSGIVAHWHARSSLDDRSLILMIQHEPEPGADHAARCCWSLRPSSFSSSSKMSLAFRTVQQKLDRLNTRFAGEHCRARLVNRPLCAPILRVNASESANQDLTDHSVKA